MNPLPKLQVVTRTDVGLVREHNEDTLLQIPDRGIFAVLDGMGGHRAGDIASQIAATVIRDIFGDARLLAESRDLVGENLSGQSADIVAAIRLGNRAVYSLALKYSALRGMGTTIVSCAFEGNLVHIAHIGDSRVYRFRAGKLELMTTDHSWVNEMIEDAEITPEQAKEFKWKNVITRVLGIRPSVKIDITTVALEKNDIFILCSDGLTTVLDDAAIGDILRRSPKDLAAAVKELYTEVFDQGAPDNITVIAIAVKEVPSAPSAGAIPLGTRRVLPEESPLAGKVNDHVIKVLFKKIDLSPYRDVMFNRKKKGNRAGAAVYLLIFLPFLLYFGAAALKNNSQKLGFSGGQQGKVVIENPSDAVVDFRTSPAGAEIYFGAERRLVGVTPFKITLEKLGIFEKGVHLFYLVKKDFVEKEITLQCEPGKTALIAEDLLPETRLLVTVQGSGRTNDDASVIITLVEDPRVVFVTTMKDIRLKQLQKTVPLGNCHFQIILNDRVIRQFPCALMQGKVARVAIDPGAGKEAITYEDF